MKNYMPLSLDDAEKFLYTNAGVNADIIDVMDDAQRLIYAEIIGLHRRIDEIENQAEQMMSPEKMADMMGNMFGGALGGK